MNFVNLTPHTINILADDGTVLLNVDPSGALARCIEVRRDVGVIGIGNIVIPITLAAFGDISGLPEAQIGTAYIVSALVLVQCVGRSDVFAPGPAARDDAGRVIGCYGLSAAPP